MLSLVLCLILSGCSSSSASATADDETKEDLAQIFASDLRTEILPNKDVRSVLAELDVFVSEEEYVQTFDSLYEFMQGYEDGQTCQLTTAFFNRSLVITRIVVIDGIGYYYRFEYDRFNKDQISLNFKTVIDISLEETPELEKCVLRLDFSSNDHALFTFRLVEGPYT